MALKNKAHVGDIGTVIRKTVVDQDANPVDLSTATRLEVKFHFPKTDTTNTETATFVTDGADGVIEVITTGGTWTAAGVWREQVQFDTPSGSWSAEWETRDVYASL